MEYRHSRSRKANSRHNKIKKIGPASTGPFLQAKEGESSLSILHLLRSDASLTINKTLARKIGLHPAIMYCEVLSKWNYFLSKHELDEEGFFYNTIENMEHDTTLSRRHQQESIKILVELKLIEYKVAGMPAKRFFKVNEDESIIISILQSEATSQFVQNEQTSLYGSDKHVCSKRTLNNTNNNTKNNTNRKSLRQAADNKQKTLINLPSKEPVDSKKLSRSEKSFKKIVSARHNEIEWDEVTDTDFANYFIERQNELMEEQIVLNFYTDVTIMREAFIRRYELERHEVADFIDHIVMTYSKHPEKWKSFTFNMINKNQRLMDQLIQSANQILRPVERTIATNTFGNRTRSSKTTNEIF